MAFKLWSESNPEAKKILQPDLGLRCWNDVSMEEKILIWKNLEDYFFYKDLPYTKFNAEIPAHEGFYKCHHTKFFLIIFSEAVKEISNANPTLQIANNFLADRSIKSGCTDFYNIFIGSPHDVVLELISLFILKIEEKKSKEDLLFKRYVQYDTDLFIDSLDKILNRFGINISVTPQEFIPRQEQKITEEIYKPVLEILSDEKWKEVSNILSDAFSDYQKQDYSGSVTHTYSSVQAFLQLLVEGKTGKKGIKELISTAKKNKLIDDTILSESTFQILTSTFEKLRKENGDAHPKKEYANEKTAKLMLNLSMVFFQHCLG